MKYAIFLVVALGLIAVGTSNSFATTGTSGDPIYLQYGTIKGDVTSADHPGWIEVNSFQFGITRSISAPTGGSADRESSAPSVSEITITKPMDSSSPQLLSQALAGTGQTVTLDLVKTGPAGQPMTYAEYKLENTLISGYSVSSGGDNPTESISLSFTKFTFTFTSQNSDGSLGTPGTVGYDIALAQVS
jgi:type VI secretion system secreted protein Hcp